MWERVEFTSPEPTRYPYPPPTLLSAKCWAITLCVKVCHKTRSIINRHLLPTTRITEPDRTEGHNRYFRFAVLFRGATPCWSDTALNQQEYPLTLWRRFLHPLVGDWAPSRIAKVILRWFSSQHPCFQPRFGHIFTWIGKIMLDNRMPVLI